MDRAWPDGGGKKLAPSVIPFPGCFHGLGQLPCLLTGLDPGESLKRRAGVARFIPLLSLTFLLANPPALALPARSWKIRSHSRRPGCGSSAQRAAWLTFCSGARLARGRTSSTNGPTPLETQTAGCRPTTTPDAGGAFRSVAPLPIRIVGRTLDPNGWGFQSKTPDTLYHRQL